MKSFRKILAILLLLVLIIPNFVIADNYISGNDLNVKIIKTEDILNNNNKVKNDLFNIEKIKDDLEELDEEVIVIVELKEKSVLEKINSEGKRLDSISQRSLVNEETKLLNNQEMIIKDLELTNDVEIKEELDNYTNIINGFAIKVNKDDIEKIEQNPNVKRVEISNKYLRPEVNMTSSTELVNAMTAWDLGYDGEGMVIAVIDTGADHEHRDFKISDDKEVALNKTEVDEIIKDGKLEGRYYNKKVPYAYNYADKSNNVKEVKPIGKHGMHVAGTVVANGDEKAGGIKGIVPEAQLLNMKVFSNNMNDPYVYSYIYTKAIDDSIKLNADVINLSLGSPAGFNYESAIEYEAIERAEAAGIVVTIASGNERNMVFNSKYKTLMHNPDVGLVGSPATSTSSITVASFENKKLVGSYFKTIPEIEKRKEFPYIDGAPVKFSSLNSNDGYEYIYIGVGDEEEFRDKDVSGKIALVKRGRAFSETIEKAQRYGAVACLVFNHEQGGDTLMNMSGGENSKIPLAFTGNSSGNILLENPNIKLVFLEEEGSIDNPNEGRVSASSSWGSTPDLKIKPEIMAPGNNIWSTQNDDKYMSMSGTSMASPHIAGGSAIVKDYVQKNKNVFGNIEGKELNNLIRNILTNTTDIQVQPSSNIPYPPRMQGAGLMNLSKATRNEIIIRDNSTDTTSKGYTKVELGDNLDRDVNFNLEIENYGNKDVEYDVEIITLGEIIEEGILTEEFEQIDASYSGDLTFIVKGNSTENINLKLDISNSNNDQFVEGYIKFIAKDNKGVDLTVPFMGFKGSWNTPRIIDTLDSSYLTEGIEGDFVEKNKKESQFKSSYFASLGLPQNPNELYLTAGNGYVLFPVISQLRNAKSMEYMILDKYEKKIITIGKEAYVKKLMRLGQGEPNRALTKGEYNGVLGNERIPDGKYIYRIESRLDYKDYKQIDDYPFKVDSYAPIINYPISNSGNKIKFLINDFIGEDLKVEDVSGVFGVYVSEEYKLYTEADSELELKEIDKEKNLYELSLDISKFLDKDIEKLTIVAVDRAMNMTEEAIQISLKDLKENIDIDSKVAYFDITNPRTQNVYAGFNNNDNMSLNIEGYLYGWEKDDLDRIEVNGKKIEDNQVVYGNINTGNYRGEGFKFKDTIEIKSGYQMVQFSAYSKGNSLNKEGNRVDAGVWLFAENTPPVLEIDEAQVEVHNGIATVNIKASDDSPIIELWRDDLFLEDSSSLNLFLGSEARFEYEDRVILKEGKNEIVYKLKDLVFEVEKTITVYNDINVSIEVYMERLKEALDIAKERLGNRDIYSEDSINNLELKIQYGDDIYKKDNSEIEDITSAIEELRLAIEGLKLKPTDNSELKDLIAKAQELYNDKNKTEESLEKLNEVLSKVIPLLENNRVTQADIDNAVEELQDAINNLEDKVITPDPEIDKKELLESISKAEKIDLSKYTVETVENLKSAIAKAKSVNNDKDTSKKDIVKAIEDIDKAIKNLKEKDIIKEVDRSKLSKEINKAENIDKSIYTRYSVNNLNNEISRAKDVLNDDNVNQDDVNKALLNLEYAIKSLIKKEIDKDDTSSNSNNSNNNSSSRDNNNVSISTKPKVVNKENKNDKTEVNIIKKKIETEKRIPYLKGYEDGTLKPENKVTREELATIISRILKEDYKKEIKLKELNFKDVEKGRWSEEAIQLLYSMDLITGYEDNTFRPTNEVTRAEFVTIISRLAELKDIDKNINLKDIDNHWAKESIKKVISKTWIKGYEDNTFKPDNALTRAELSSVLNKVLERGNDYKIEENFSSKDLLKDKWYYEDILKAVSK